MERRKKAQPASRDEVDSRLIHRYYSAQRPSKLAVAIIDAPLRVWLPDKQPFTLSGPIKSPRPFLALDPNFGLCVRYYQGDVTFVLPLTVRAEGEHVLPAMRRQNLSPAENLCS